MVLKSKNLELTQAVLICDNFNDTFQPIQSDQQFALLKIVNCPIIEYTLTFLKSNGIEQVIIFSSNARKLKDYLEERKWIKENDEIPFAIVIASDSLSSLGDVMRDVFNNNLVKNDFILINGNVIGGNLPLLKYLKEHINRRKNEDKGSLITMIYMKLDFNHRSRSKANEPIVVVNKDTQKMLFYENGNSTKKIELKLDLFPKNPNLKIHFDLQDTNIAVCSMAVPQLFADNFDYNTKDDFIHSILVHEEILENTIYIRTVDEGSYAVQVDDAFSFDSVSRDIIERWSFPAVPDLQEDLCYHRHNIYRSSSVDLKIDSVLKRNLVVGKHTSIDSGARIKESVIGANCRLGKNVRLDGCYLMDNVVIENDCELSKCILSSNVLIKKNCQLKAGCILGANCVLGPNVRLEQCTLLQANAEFDDEKLDSKLVGSEGKGYLYKADDESDLEENGNKPRVRWGQSVNVEESIENSSSDDSEPSDDEFDGQLEDDDEFDDEFKKFYDEVIDSLHRGLEEKIQCKNLILEINCSK